ncbi:prepilin peptidase [Actinoplanes missouriensis]|uniref:prepilin peptidase n=1 Tax=Actinoplanes missouriensis TaxID=1866 RepID=UPI0033E06839
MSIVFGGASAAFVPRVAYRLSVAAGVPPRAACVACGRRFAAGFPGWCRAGSVCPHAGRQVDHPFPGTVVAGAAAAGLLAVTSGPAARLPLLLVATVLGVLLAAVDRGCLRLPDPLVALFAVVAGAGLAVPARLPVALAAGALVGAFYLFLALLPGRGLGLGDVKLGAVLGFVLGFGGWTAVAAGFAAAHAINGGIAAWLLITRRAGGERALPFGPALLAGALIGITAV